MRQKGRWPKNERKRVLLRSELAAAKEYKAAMDRRDGKTGAASDVRRIDPNSDEGREIIARLKPRA